MALDEYLSKDDFRREMGHYATKADLAQMETRLVKWMVGLMVGLMIASAGIGATVAVVVVQRLAG